MLGKIPEDIKVLKNLDSIGEIKVEIFFRTLIGMSLVLLGDSSLMISFISSGEQSSKYILDSSEFLI